MQRLYLHIQAPFAAFRVMQAGVYRSTLPIIPPSAAYGLVMNLAGLETRGEDNGITTLMRADLPALRLAIGRVSEPSVSTLYQQLHSYPVGNSGKEFQSRTYGSKYWIAPVRREVLVGLDAVIGIESADAALLAAVRSGLRGELDRPRYGLPFAGDNNFLFDRIEALTESPSACWFSPLTDEQPRAGSVRLTVAIDRADASRTSVALLAPESQGTSTPPEAAWLWVPKVAKPLADRPAAESLSGRQGTQPAKWGFLRASEFTPASNMRPHLCAALSHTQTAAVTSGSAWLLRFAGT